MKESVAGQSADGQANQQLDQVALMVALDDWYEKNAEKTSPADGQHRTAGEKPTLHQFADFNDFSKS